MRKKLTQNFDMVVLHGLSWLRIRTNAGILW